MKQNKEIRDTCHPACPFYHRDETVNIRCEGIAENNRIVLQFNSKKGRTDHMDKFCRKNPGYKECAIYQILLKKYE